MYDLIIIGSGPAGITAGIYAKRANLKVLVFEKGAPGGQILNTAEIENYPGFKKTSGYELASSMFEHLLELGCEVVFNEVINITNNDTYKTVHTNNETYNAKAVLIAAGAVPRTLNVENEDLFTSNGISWCAICDGPLYKDKKVVVVGGGNSAVEESVFLANIAKHITVVQNLDRLTADPKAIEALKRAPNVDIVYNSKVIKFLGNSNLEGVVIETNGQELEIKCDGVFEYIGLMPSTTFLKDLNILNHLGYLEVDENFETKVKGIFGAGDSNHKKVRQVVTAVSDGAIAIQNILKYLESI